MRQVMHTAIYRRLIYGAHSLHDVILLPHFRKSCSKPFLFIYFRPRLPYISNLCKVIPFIEAYDHKRLLWTGVLIV